MPDVAIFLLGLAASVPVGILVNLLTPRTSAWWGRRSAAAAARNDAREQELDARADELFAHPDHLAAQMHQMVLLALLFIVLFAGAAFIVLGMALIAGRFGTYADAIVFSASALVTTGAIVYVRLFVPAIMRLLDIGRRVRERQRAAIRRETTPSEAHPLDR